MEILKRHILRKNEFRQLKEELKKSIGPESESLFTTTAEIVKTDRGELYAENKTMLAFKHGTIILPSLRALNAGKAHLPTVTVDMGAVPYITNGADIMAPGITKLSQGLKKGDFVAIVDERYGKTLAIGELLVDGEEILMQKKGKVIKNIHYVNDELWLLQL